MRLPIDFVRKNDVCHIAEININISTSQHLHLYSENQWKSMEINGNQWKLTKWAMDGHGASCFGPCVTDFRSPRGLRKRRHGIHHLFHLEAHLHLGRNDFFLGA